jgi:ABC-2 type transport system permease protein
MLNKLAAIIRKDTNLRFEARSELLFFLVLPLVFTFLLGGGSPGADGDNRALIPVVDEDGGERAAAFLAALAESETIRPQAFSRADAEELLDEESVGAIIIIPAGFGDGLTAAGVLSGTPAEIALRSSPNSNVAPAVEGEIRHAVDAIARPLLVARNGVAAVEALDDETVRPFADEAARVAFFENTLAAAESALADQPARVEYSVLGGGQEYDPRAQASAGQLITWVFIPLLGASGLFAFERAIGTLRRLLVTPTRKSTFLLGSIGGQFFAALAQMVILVLFGIYVMNVPWGQDPAALIVVLVAFGLAGVALGTALGTFVKTESQASNLSIMLGMSMALLGGAWWPMELFPPGLQQVVKVLPTTWAMSAMTDITMRGQGLIDILPEAAVLLGFAAVFFAVGVWRFRYE